MAKRAAETDRIKKALLSKKDHCERWSLSDFVSTGSTILNCALTNSPFHGFGKGLFYFLVGDSQSGKTWLSLSCLAEAAANNAFDGYRFVHDNAENGALMDIEYFFGKKVAKRLEAPRYDNEGGPLYSTLTEDFYVNLINTLEKGPCIYILDSMDALTSNREQVRFREVRDKILDGDLPKDDMVDNKAKINAKGLRTVFPLLRETGSILLILNQTRDNLGGNSMFQEKTRSGGRALTFYSHVEIWTSVVKTKKKMVRGKDRTIGVDVQLKVKKNRIVGKSQTVKMPIYYDMGIDDMGACVDYLVDEGFWKMTGRSIDARATFANLAPVTRTRLIETIEENGYEKIVQKAVGETWLEIEKACQQNRKRRYL